MIRVFISQPMRDKTNEQIKTERKRALESPKQWAMLWYTKAS